MYIHVNVCKLVIYVTDHVNRGFCTLGIMGSENKRKMESVRGPTPPDDKMGEGLMVVRRKELPCSLFTREGSPLQVNGVTGPQNYRPSDVPSYKLPLPSYMFYTTKL